MAQGDNFTWTPNVVVPECPEFHNIVTPSDSMKKNRANVSSDSMEIYKLTFNKLTSANMNAILTHFKENYGEYYPFTWTSVPSYINSGSNMTVYYVKKSFSASPVSNMFWKVEVKFEKQVA